jgi:hypothetical protein
VLLLAAGNAARDDDLRAELATPLDWTHLAWLADWERASSVLWRRLSGVAADRVPGDVAESFQRLTMVTDFRALYMKERCDAVLDAFGRAGIEVLLLKGAALAHTAYGEFTDRPMGDLDILVPAERASEAWSIATGLGWAWESAVFPDARYEGHHHLPPLFDSHRTGAKLELHSRLSVPEHPFSVGFPEVRAAARRLPAPRDHVLVLDAEHQLVHVAVHFAWSHEMSFGAWRAFRDVGALEATAPVDWSLVSDVARRHQASTSCYWTFRLARRLAGVGPSDDVLQAFEVHTPRWLRGAVERHLTTQIFAREDLCPSEKIRRLMWTIALSPRRIGQGSRRPWAVTDVELSRDVPRERVSRRLGYHLGHLMNWWRYLRTVAATR